MGVSAHYADLAPAPPRPTSIALPIRAQSSDPAVVPAANRDKTLPPPPGQRSALMTKSHTTDTNVRKVSGVTFDLPGDKNRPSIRPRSQTQSAHEVLQANERNGVISEPKSALDRIIGERPVESSLNGSTSSNSTAILKPINPTVPLRTVSFSANQPRLSETPEVAQESPEKERSDIKGKGRAVSSSSVVSSSSRMSRRSLSMSDVVPEPQPVCFSPSVYIVVDIS